MSSSKTRRILIPSLVGNALEFYDFTLYAVFAGVVAATFFPGDDSTAQLLASLAAFAVGYFARPLGAFIFGYIGDTGGRKKALSYSVLLMGVPTLLIGLAPGYEQIGVAASVLIFVCRVCQGIFAGGEYNGAAIFSIEHLGKRQPGLVGGVIAGSCVLGAGIATLWGAMTQRTGMPEWAWRVPFIFGGLIGVMGFYMRRNIEESPEFCTDTSQRKQAVLQGYFSRPGSSFLAFFLGSFNGVLTYTLFGYLNIFLSRYLGVPLDVAMGLNVFGLLAFMLGCPLMGWIFDTQGQSRFFNGATLLIFASALPIFGLLLTGNHTAVLLAEITLGLCVASIAGPAHAVMQGLFPVEERYRGIAFNFSLGMGVVGGITPMIYVHLIERMHASLYVPAYVLMAFAAVFTVLRVRGVGRVTAANADSEATHLPLRSHS